MKQEMEAGGLQDKNSCPITHTDAESQGYVVLFKKILRMMKVCYILYSQSAPKGFWVTILCAFMLQSRQLHTNELS